MGSQLSNLLGLFIFSFVLRFPFFFRDVIDWDESTFFLMGQAVLNGHLPYTTIWDVKPLFVFWGFGTLMATLGRSVVSIRLAGMLLVWIAGFLTLMLSRSLGMHYLQARLVGVLTITLLTFFWSGQATMSEHLAIVPLIMALWLMIANPNPRWMSGITGVLMAIVCLIRTNLAYTAVALGLYTLISHRKNFRIACQFAGLYTIGFISTFLLTLIPFIRQGQARLWWQFVILLPLKYASARSLELTTKIQRLGGWGTLLLIMVLSLHLLIVYRLNQWCKDLANPILRRGVVILGIAFVATEISILRTGMGEFHYLLQLAPFLAIATVACSQFLTERITRWAGYICAGLWMISLSIPIHSWFVEVQSLQLRIAHGQPWHYGSAYAVADYFKTLRPPVQSVYLMDDHLVYGLLNIPSFTPLVAHPSTIVKPYFIETILGEGHTKLAQFKQLLRQKPEFIVHSESLWYMVPNHELADYLAIVLKSEYQKVKEIQGQQIYCRTDSTAYRDLLIQSGIR